MRIKCARGLIGGVHQPFCSAYVATATSEMVRQPLQLSGHHCKTSNGSQAGAERRLAAEAE